MSQSTPHEMVVHSRQELAAAIRASAQNGPTTIRFESPSGKVKVTYRFNQSRNPLVTQELSEQRASRIAAKVLKTSSALWD